MSGRDQFTRHGEAWTEEVFLAALGSDEDRQRALRLFGLNGSIPASYRWFGTRPRGAIFFHPAGLPFAPLRVLIKDGVLLGQGTWTTYGDALYHDGFAEMAALLDQDYHVTPKRFVIADFDIGELWAFSLRCAAAINEHKVVPATESSIGVWAEPDRDGVAQSLQTWLFQANPDRYDIRAVLESGEPITEWSITHHVGDLAPGDRAVLWVGGRKDPGVYGVGTVTGEPFSAVIDDRHWRQADDQGTPIVRCPVSFDIILRDYPIPKAELKADPRFAGSRIITQPFAGNPFLLSDIEWQAVAERLPPAPAAPAIRSPANVWLEVQHRARAWMADGTPVYTLKRNVRNLITHVTDTKIERRSDEPRGGGDAPVTRRKIEELWEALVRDGHTRNVPSPLYFAHALLQHAIPGVGYEEHPTLSLVLTDAKEANRVFDPAAEEVSGLTPAPPARGGAGRRGGGGEGEVHAALKAKVKNDPVAAVGEALTYISEDLTDRLGDEISFITGDRVDLLMKDQEGNYVVIEVEPVIGPTDHVGFHQAAKYWVLIAVAKGIDLDRVRRMVVATAIDPNLRDHYRDRYGIEWVEVSLS